MSDERIEKIKAQIDELKTQWQTFKNQDWRDCGGEPDFDEIDKAIDDLDKASRYE